MVSRIISHRFWLPVVLILLALVNRLASVVHARIDLTDEHRFTISNATKNLLRKIDAPVTIDVFLKGNLNSGFKQLAASTDDELREFKEIGGNRIQYHFVSPEDIMPGTNTSYADTLTSLGMYPINLTVQVKEGQEQQYVYPFALLHYGEKIMPVELYKGNTPLIGFADLNSAAALMEYRFADGISKITKKEQDIVGYATGNGEPEIGRYNTYDLVENLLRPNYQLFKFDLSSPKFLPEQMKVLIMVKPATGFSEDEKLKLDQYVMNGGKLLMFVDRLNAEMDSLQIKNQVVAFDRDLQLTDFLFNYGVKINPDLLMDLQCDYLRVIVNESGQDTLLPWNYFPVMESKSDNPVTKGLGFVSGKFVNTLDTVAADGIRKTVLLSSSANARTIGSPAIISPAENSTLPEDSKYTRNNLPTAILLEGKFHSLFANRLSAAMRDSLEAYQMSFLPQCIASNKMIIAGDGDIALNSVVKNEPIPMGMNPSTVGTQREFPFANKEFIQSCLDYLINDNGLSEAKAKDYTPHLLDTKKIAEQKTFWQIIDLLLPALLILFFAFIFSSLRKRKYVRRKTILPQKPQAPVEQTVQ